MSILGAVSDVAVNGLWKAGAIGLAATLVASSSYLGYQWHASASARDAVTVERNDALERVGGLTRTVELQNQAVSAMAVQTADRKKAYDDAMAANAPFARKLDSLAAAIRAKAPSTTCEQSLARQRAAIEGLK